MRPFFPNYSLRRKLILAMLLSSAAAVVLTIAVLSLYHWQHARRTLVERFRADADLLAANSAAALAFNDARAAHEALATLRAAPEIVQAWLYRQDGTVLTAYDTANIWPAPPAEDGYRFLRRRLLVFAPVRFGDEVVGRIGLLADASGYQRALLADLGLTGLVALVALGIACWLAVRLTGVIVAPVRALTSAARRLIAGKDEALRVGRESNDEVGQLVDVFNEMLTVIQTREAELRESEERFRSAFASAPMGLALSGLDGRIVRVNEAVVKLVGRSREELLQGTMGDLFPAAERDAVQATLAALVAGRRAMYDAEHRLEHATGHTVWARVSLALVTNAQGQPLTVLSQWQDVTARKEAQQRLLEQQAQIRTLLDAVPDLMFRVRADGTIVDFHAQDPRQLYMPPAQIVGQRMADLLPATAGGILMTALRRTLATGVLQQVEYELPMPAGVETFEGRLVKGTSNEVTMIVRNVTTRRRLERQLMEVSEYEQRRIGQDLHDGLCQQLVGLGFMVQLLEQRLAASGAPQVADVREIAGHLKQALQDARQVSHGLHPVRLDEEGLGLALRELAEQAGKGGVVTVEFDYPETVPVPDNNMATHLYRIAQEAVNNALKHGHPRRILISLTREDQELELRVEDDGVGLEAAKRAAFKGIGLQVMEYRARMIGGMLDVGPRQAGGTVVTCLCRREGQAV